VCCGYAVLQFIELLELLGLVGFIELHQHVVQCCRVVVLRFVGLLELLKFIYWVQRVNWVYWIHLSWRLEKVLGEVAAKF
jgi:hypothetical protein